MKIGKQSYLFENVYVLDGSVAIGNMEGKGKIKPYADITYDDAYFGEKSFEAAERKMQRETIDNLKHKLLMIDQNIDLLFGGDLINQEIISTFTMKDFDIPFVALYGACSTFAIATIMSAIFVEHDLAKNVIAMASSHNQSAERTFRFPNEYGGAKATTSTFTVTGCGALMISNKKSAIRISKATIGKVCDINYNNQFDLGSAMVPSAIETLVSHFEDFKTTADDYDLILTGDLSQIGRSLVYQALHDKYGSFKNYDDCGLYVYDYFDQKVYSGGSGCACSAVVTAGYVKAKLLSGELKKVLICATGALFNATTTLQKESIPSIAHAFVLEAVE